MRRTARACSALALLVGATVLPACSGPANLTQVANDLQTELMSMPGVADAWVYHDESYAEGVIFNVAVDVATATRAEIVAVADQIAATRINLVANYTQNVEFWVAPDKPVTIRRHSHIDAAQIADDAERLRVIAANADGRIDWFRGDNGAINQLSVSRGRTPGADLLDTVRRTAGETGLTLSVSPSSPSPVTPRMSVSFPLSTEGQTSIEHFLDSVPVGVFGLRIEHDGVRALQAMVPGDPAVAERDLTTAIDASKAVATSPMWLAWYVPSAVGGVPMFDGVVEVGDCSAPAGQIRQTSLRATHHDTATLATRLQSEIDTCAAPDLISAGPTPSSPEVVSPSPTSASGSRGVPDSVRAHGATSVVVHPSPVPTGNTTKGIAATRPLRPPSPVPSAGPNPRPAAGQDPAGHPPAGDKPQAAKKPPHSTSRTARSAR
ncbi:hypothetical protein ORI20_18500 [Mycobacterium sp. CVI_P3]|uniref:Uncharacterized protein n=1 Tax=Mycobacterium pinniadriaticum TaxID=2994102 RepID=A0ABT3SIF7_9MYCO|nr:hypothetical protein [Mycobacterium pinniadriaticum]MCX2932268.1 hypothetical protein [Mycobacterium pinniadriaticum]MCX2938632.1 hypothetical protein [Mycobacterium pinniadriaticum]